MDPDHFVALRPFAYHVTAASNLPRLQATRVVESAERLYAHAGEEGSDQLAATRARAVTLRIGEHRVWLRDQRHFDPRAVRFEPGWDVARYVRRLNDLAYFWPGSAEGPADMGRRDIERARREGDVVVLRVPTSALLAWPGQPEAEVTRCHSGAAHTQQGRKVSRGTTTFTALRAFPIAAEVQELVFAGGALLPPEVQHASSPAGPWSVL